MKTPTIWEPSQKENELFDAIKEQADKIADGWIEINVPECDETKAPAFTVNVPRIPFERWMRDTQWHREDEWKNVCPSGLKMYMDDRNHSDWWIASRLPIQFAYGRKEMSYRDFLSEDDPEYTPPASNEEELINKSKRLLSHSWLVRLDSDSNRVRNSIFLVSNKKTVKGFVYHVKSPADIEGFVEQAKGWRDAWNKQDVIAVVPNCSIEYDQVIRFAGAVITEIGSAAAHLVKVAREDKIPVIMCPNAFNEFFHYEHIKIEQKNIYSQ